MLNHIGLRNFRSWTQLDVDLKPITLIFGPNSSGKTAVLDSLLMLKQTSESNDRGRSLCFNGYADLGSYRELIHRHDEALRLDMQLSWVPREKAILRDPAEGTGKYLAASGLSYMAQWGLVQDVNLTNLTYRAPELDFSLTRNDEGRYEWSVQPERVLGKRRQGKPWPLPTPESCYALPRVVAQEWPTVNLLELNHQFELLMERIQYVGPLRRSPRREYLWSGESPSTIGADGSQAVEALFAHARTHAQATNGRSRKTKGLVAETEKWLQRFGLADNFRVVPIDKGQRYYEVRLSVPSSAGVDTALPDVGFGVSQVLPIIVQLLFAPEGSILLFEQPEIHLHPRAAALLADLFLEVAAQRNLQLIVESHSEYFLSRLQRRVAENELPYANPEHIAIYFCDLRNGESCIEPVRLNLFGQIENWPEDFFGDSIGDLRAMTEAMLRRKRQGGDSSGSRH